MKFYLEPQPAVYEAKFRDNCRLCMAGGITRGDGEITLDELKSGVGELLKPYRRVYEIKPGLSVSGSSGESPSYISLACQLFPVDVLADRRNADDDRIPMWLEPLINASIKNSVNVVVAQTHGEAWETIKRACGLKTDCVFMSRLEDSFNPDDQKSCLEYIIAMALSYAIFPKPFYPKTSGHVNDKTLIITGEVVEVVYKEHESKPGYFL